jgi:hypothetical protein
VERWLDGGATWTVIGRGTQTRPAAVALELRPGGGD